MTNQDEEQSVVLPWRKGGLDGFSTTTGPTFNGGCFAGGGPAFFQTLAVRVLTPLGRRATVELDLCDDRDGRSVTLDPDTARAAARALLAGADQAEAEMARYRRILDEQRAAIQAMQLRHLAEQAGEAVSA